MSREYKRPMTEEERAARELLRSLPDVKADADFRARLRARFQQPAPAEDRPETDRMQARRPAQRPALRRAARSLPAAKVPPGKRPRPSHRVERWIVAGVSLAAAVLLVVALLRGSPADDWTVRADATATLTIDGAPHPVAGLDPDRLRPGARVRSGDHEVVLQAGREMVWVLTPHTEATLPVRSGPSREVAESAVHEGELRITTGPDYRLRLRIETQEAVVEVAGTTLAVIRNATGTCLCVYEGTVRMDHRGDADPPRDVPAGKRWVIQADGTSLPFADLEGGESMKLQMLHDQTRADYGQD